jgi:hypothetical protein
MLAEINVSSSLGRLEAVQRMHSCKRRHSARQSYLPSFKLDTDFHCAGIDIPRPGHANRNLTASYSEAGKKLLMFAATTRWPDTAVLIA